MKRLLFGLALASALSAVSLAAAPARKSTVSSIVLNVPAQIASVQAAAEAWEPRLGDTVSFTSIFPESLLANAVSIKISCFQNGALVFATAGLHGSSFLLGGNTSPWLDRGGPATCHAALYYWSPNGTKFNVLASTEFDAEG